MSLWNRELPLTPQTYLLYTDNQDTGMQVIKQVRNQANYTAFKFINHVWKMKNNREQNEKLTKRLYSKVQREKWANKFIHRTVSLQNKDLASMEGKKIKSYMTF